mgnify:CR=1 FL=1
MNESGPYFQGPKLTGGEFEWIIDAIHHAATNGLAEEDFPELPEELLAEEPDPLGRKFGVAAWFLRQIAEAAIERLDRLPEEAQRAVCSESIAWPTLISPSVSRSAALTSARILALGLGANLPLDLNHNTKSEHGKWIPAAGSIRPGIGLAAKLHAVLLEVRDSEALEDSAFADYPAPLVMAAEPELLAAAFEETSEKIGMPADAPLPENGEPNLRTPDVEAAQKARTALGRKLHCELLIATLPNLTLDTVEHWALAGLRFLQAENDGFLVHDICSDKRQERLSQWLSQDYWEATKTEAANAGKNALSRLDSKLHTALREGFRKVPKNRDN